MLPGESSCPGGSDSVWQRGVEGISGRVMGDQSLPYFQQKNSCECGVQKNKHGRNFQIIASKTNQGWVINYDKPLIHFGTDIVKILAVLVFLNTSYFDNGQHFVALTQLRATKTGSKICCTHLSYTFSESWVRKVSVGTCPEKFSHWKFFGYEAIYEKVPLFTDFCVRLQKKVSGSCTHNFDARGPPNS